MTISFHFGVLAPRQLRTARNVKSTLSKNNSCSPSEIHICWKSNVFFQSMFSFKRSLTQANAMTPRDRRDLSTNSRSLWTESNAYVKNSLVRVMHTERNHALCYTFSFEMKATLKFMMQLKTFLAQLSVNRSRIVSSSETELLLAFHSSCIASSRSSAFPDSLSDSVPFEHFTPFDLTLDLWRSALTDSIGPARSQPILLLLQLLIVLKTWKDPGPAAVAADCAATGLQCIKMFAIMHPSRCFPSFVVVVVMIAATIFDQHVLTTRESCDLAMVP